MNASAKLIRLSQHAKEQIKFRGCTEEEVEKAIRSCSWEPAELGRLECRMTLPFNKEWNGRSYATKTIRPIFVEEKDLIAVVTVYVYYGKEKEPL